jgi:hypothetical protein
VTALLANAVMLGAVAMASVVASLFFFRFWRQTRDRFFVFFAVSFLGEGLDRIAIGLTALAVEREPLFYMPRLITYGLIILAIVDKNWSRRPGPGRVAAEAPRSSG